MKDLRKKLSSKLTYTQKVKLVTNLQGIKFTKNNRNYVIEGYISSIKLKTWDSPNMAIIVSGDVLNKCNDLAKIKEACVFDTTKKNVNYGFFAFERIFTNELLAKHQKEVSELI